MKQKKLMILSIITISLLILLYLIVVFKKHIGIVSDKRNRHGINFVIHHTNPYQKYYEEDILEHRNDIIGHYRIS